jgi:hypothetical protein
MNIRSAGPRPAGLRAHGECSQLPPQTARNALPCPAGSVEDRVRLNEDSINRLINMIADPDIYTASDGSWAEMITHGTLEIGGVERERRANFYYFTIDGESLAGVYEIDPDTHKPVDPDDDSETNDA